MQLKYLYFELTRLCNQNCVQCFNNSRHALPDEMDTPSIIRAIEAFKRQGGERLQLTGGESLARRGFLDILAAVKDLAFQHVTLSTNGLLLTEKMLTKVEDAVDEIDLSLDGFREEHDFLRGVRCYDQSLRAIRLAGASSCATFVCSCVSKPMLPRLDEFIEMLIGYGIDCLKLAQIGDVGRRKTPPAMLLSGLTLREQFDLFQEKIFQYRSRGLVIFQSLSLNPQIPSVDEDGLVADPRGKLFPMIGLLPDAWTVGNIRDGFEIDEARIRDYQAVVAQSLVRGVQSIGQGTPVNWWTLFHEDLERAALRGVPA